MAVVNSVFAAKDSIAQTVKLEKDWVVGKFMFVMTLIRTAASDCKDGIKKEITACKKEGLTAYAKQKYTMVKRFGAKPNVKVTALSAAGGAVTVGATGGVMGLSVGAGIGAAVGVVPAIFTFGLSIPIGAVMGGACGLCAGTIVGGSAGLVGGGAVGNYCYEHKAEIDDAYKGVKARVTGYATKVHDYATKSKAYAVSFVSGTGGTQ